MRKAFLAVVCLVVTVPVVAATKPSPAAPTFAIVTPGAAPIMLRECSEIGSVSEVVEYRTGSDPAATQKIPGKLTVLNVTCSRALSSDKSLSLWRQSVESGSDASYRRDGSLVLYDNAMKEVARWNFTDAWPSKVSVHIDSESNVAMETVTLVMERIERP